MIARRPLLLCLVLTAAVSLEPPSEAQSQSPLRWVESTKEATTVTYRLSHPLHTMEAVSKDARIRTEIDVEKKEIRTVSARVDVTTFDSGNSNRDSHAMEVIDSITYPDATFTSSTILDKGDGLVASGKLTFHGVSRDIVANAQAHWKENSLEVEGAFNISLTDFKIERPSLLMIPTSDTLRFSFSASFDLR